MEFWSETSFIASRREREVFDASRQFESTCFCSFFSEIVERYIRNGYIDCACPVDSD